jgi:hypothetical protein
MPFEGVREDGGRFVNNIGIIVKLHKKRKDAGLTKFLSEVLHTGVGQRLGQDQPKCQGQEGGRTTPHRRHPRTDPPSERTPNRQWAALGADRTLHSRHQNLSHPTARITREKIAAPTGEINRTVSSA